MKEFPFDSNRKMMSVIVKDDAGKHFVVTKGAPDVLFSRCESILWDGKTAPFNKEYQSLVNREMDGLASLALRMIAVGYKPLSAGNITPS